MRTLAHLHFQISQPSSSLLQAELFEQSKIHFALRSPIFQAQEYSQFCLDIEQGLRFHDHTAST